MGTSMPSNMPPSCFVSQTLVSYPTQRSTQRYMSITNLKLQPNNASATGALATARNMHVYTSSDVHGYIKMLRVCDKITRIKPSHVVMGRIGSRYQESSPPLQSYVQQHSTSLESQNGEIGCVCLPIVETCFQTTVPGATPQQHDTWISHKTATGG